MVIINLVVIDKRTKYPEVARVNSTTAQPMKKKLEAMFATHGTPRRLESDNGPPFQSQEFAEFAERRISSSPCTPGHTRADAENWEAEQRGSNGEAENFMKY